MKLRFVLAALLYLNFSSGLFAQTKQPSKRADGLTNEATPTGAIKQLIKPTTTAGQHAQANYGKLPLRFEANKGQIDGRVKFLAHARGYSVFLSSNETVLSVHQIKRGRHSASTTTQVEMQQGFGHDTTETVAVRLKLVGGNPAAQIEARGELPGKSNYFIGSDPAKWRTNVSSYSRVEDENAYPGIDVSYYGTRNKLETDFIVAPGANPSQIRLAIDGATRVQLDSKGNLRLRTAGGDLIFEKPLAYQGEDEAKRWVRAKFAILSNDHLGSQIVFRVAAYDSSKPLVIDPVLTYSSYLGGGFADEAYSIAVDASGSAYVVGATASSNFPTTPQAFQASSKGGSCAGLFQVDPVCGDAFVTKLNPQGTAVVYSTYLGGSGADWAVGVALDASGNAYVTGHTSSMDFPTTPGAFQTTCGPCDSSGAPGNGFITKLSPQGNSLVYSTYLGGTADTNQDTNYDPCGSIAVDSSGSVYVTGCTTSVFPTSPGAFQTTAQSTAAVQGFVAKVNPNGSALVYSTYLAGPGFNQTKGIVVDANGDVYVTGFAAAGFPTTPGAFQTDAKGTRQAFVTELNPTGSALVYSTFLGGSVGAQSGPAQQFGTGIALDSSGNVYVTGSTTTTDFPVTSGAFQTTFGGASDGFGDAFVTKLSASGSALIYSTYLGGSADDFGSSIAVDSSGDAIITGYTSSTNFPLANAFQSKSGGGTDAFVSELDPTGSTLVFSTYLGGSQSENFAGDLRSGAAAVDSQGNAYVTGFTSSPDFPVTPGAAQTSFGGGADDAFVAKISLGAAPPPVALTVASTNPTTGVAITVSPSDNNGQGNGNTQFMLSYNNGAVVTLTAPAAAGGNNFSIWTGCDSTSGASCTVTMNADRTVTANFVAPVTHSLTVASTNPSSGVAITVSPSDNSGQSNITTPVTLAYNAGISVALTALSSPNGNSFSNWTGCDSAPGLTCTVTTNADRTVTANYAVPVTSPSITSIAPGSGVQGQSIPNFIVVGNNFKPTSALSFSGDAGIHVNTSTVTATQIAANISIAIVAATGVRDVIVTNPDGQKATRSGAFTVITAPPALLPVISVLPTSLDFGTVSPSGPATMQVLTVSNTGTAPLLLTGIRSSNPAFTFSAASMGPIAPQGNTTITISFSPRSGAIGTINGVLTINDNASPVSIVMTGISRTDDRPLLLLPIDSPLPGPPLDIQPVNNHRVRNTVVTDFIIRNLTGTWFEVTIDASSPPINAPTLVNFNSNQIPSSFLIGPNEALKFPKDGTDLTFSQGQYLNFRASDLSLKAGGAFALDMFTRGVFGVQLRSSDLSTAVLSQLADDLGGICLGSANQMLSDAAANNPDAVAWDVLQLLTCVIQTSPALVREIANVLSVRAGSAAAATWLKIAPTLGPASIILFDAVNFANLMVPLAYAQLTAHSPGHVLLEVPFPGNP